MWKHGLEKWGGPCRPARGKKCGRVDVFTAYHRAHSCSPPSPSRTIANAALRRRRLRAPPRTLRFRALSASCSLRFAIAPPLPSAPSLPFSLPLPFVNFWWSFIMASGRTDSAWKHCVSVDVMYLNRFMNLWIYVKLCYVLQP